MMMIFKHLQMLVPCLPLQHQLWPFSPYSLYFTYHGLLMCAQMPHTFSQLSTRKNVTPFAGKNISQTIHQDNSCLYLRSHFKCHFFSETFSDSLNLNQNFLLHAVYMFFPFMALIPIIIINLFYNILCVTFLPFLTIYSMRKGLLFLHISLFLPLPPSLSLVLKPRCLAQDSFSIHTLKRIVQLINMLTDLLF